MSANSNNSSLMNNILLASERRPNTACLKIFKRRLQAALEKLTPFKRRLEIFERPSNDVQNFLNGVQTRPEFF